MANLIPAPNQSRVYPNNYLAIGDYALTRDNIDVKINYIPTDKLQIFGRYSFSPTLVFDPPSLGEAGGDATNGGQPGRAPGLIQSTGIGGTYTFSPHVLLDGVFGYTRLRLSAQERRHRQELRPGCSEDSGHERHRPAAGRLSPLHVQHVLEPRQPERLESVPVPR